MIMNSIQKLTVPKIAKLFSRDRTSVLRWIKNRKFPNAELIKSPIGEYWVVPESDLNNFIPPKPGPVPKQKVKQYD